MSTTVFERNPKKTIISVILIILISLDVATERLLDRNNMLNELLHTINPNLAYKVEIWQHRKQNPYYHHDLAPLHDFIETWGALRYRLVTNSLGFKDSAKRVVPPDSSKKRILFIGDSFTEGLGVPYEKTFVGLVDRQSDHEKYEVLNAGVVSYSPKIYYHKVKHLLEKAHLKISELYVFIDISDIFNELEYEIFDPEDSYVATLSGKIEELGRHYSFMYNIARYYYTQVEIAKKLQSLDYVSRHRDEAPLWTLKETAYREWGEKGVRLAELHMQKLVDLCRANGIKMTIAVYPWQNELIFGNRNSRQIRIWRDFAEANNIGFLNFYPDFFDAPFPGISPAEVKPYDIINRYFIPGDIHWNEAGHRLIAKRIQIR